MRTTFLSALAAMSLLSAQLVPAAEQSDAAADLKALVSKVRSSLQQGKTNETQLADELKEFDALVAKHKDEKTDQVAQILLMKAMLYQQVMDNTPKAVEIIEQVKRDFPETKAGQNADLTIKSIQQQEEARKVERSLMPGTKFPDFNEKDIAGKPLSIANYKGKVVLLDFWATWCGPCVSELPNVQKTYEKYHPKGFEIIGISLDDSEQKLTDFTKSKNMPWQQYFDGKGWQNKLAEKYGVKSIPATYLLDGEGKIIAKNLRGEALEEAVSKALASK